MSRQAVRNTERGFRTAAWKQKRRASSRTHGVFGSSYGNHDAV